MGNIQKRKRQHKGHLALSKKYRLKRRTKDHDQIDDDLKAGVVEKLLAQAVDFDKPGLGQFYCVHCAKDFINGDAFKSHIKGKPHKRRMHALKTEPYTIEESQRAGGMGSYIAPAKRKMETLLPESIVKGETIADVKRRALGLGDIPTVDGEDVKEKGGDDISVSEDEEGDKRM